MDSSHATERGSVCTSHSSPGHKGKHKDITGAKEGGRYLRKNMEAECTAKLWNKILTLEMMVKKMRHPAKKKKMVAMYLGEKCRAGVQR